MRRQMIFFALITLGISSCQKEKLSHNTEQFDLVKGETILDHSGELFTNFSLFTRSSGKDSILVYDSNTSQFGFFNASKKELLSTLPIELEGPNFMDFPLIDFEFRDRLLFVLSKNYFSIFDSAGKITYRFSSSDLNGLFENYFISDFEFLENNNVVFIHTHLDLVYGRANGNKEEYKLFSILNLEDGSFRTLDFEMPNELTSLSEEGYVQEYVIPTFEIADDKLIYSFPFSSKIYIADLESESISIRNPKITLISRNREKANKSIFGSSDWIPYFYSSVKYSELAHDSKSKKFTQVAYSFTKDDSGKPKNTKYLFVYDDSLKLVSEIELTDLIMEPAIFTNGKILLQKSMPVQNTEEGTEFVTYTIKASDTP